MNAATNKVMELKLIQANTLYPNGIEPRIKKAMAKKMYAAKKNHTPPYKKKRTPKKNSNRKRGMYL